MTLILAIVTPRWAALLSDRRVTTYRYGPDRKPVIETQEDSDTKSMIIDHRYVMGFSGLARIGTVRQRMENWLTDTLHKTDPAQYFETIAERMGHECQKRRYQQAHTFLAAGYQEDKVAGRLVPEIVVVSNSLTGDEEVIGQVPSKPYSFNVKRVRLDGRKYRLLSAGAKLDLEDRRLLKSRLQRWGGKNEINSNKIVPELVRVLRHVASSSSGTVGTAGVITTFPISAVPLPVGMSFFMDGGMPVDTFFRREEISFSFPAEDRPWDPRRYSPGRIGMMMMQNAEMHVGRRTELKHPDHTMSDAEAAFRKSRF